MKKQLKDYPVKEKLIPFPVRLQERDLNLVKRAGYNVSQLLRDALKDMADQIREAKKE